MRWLWICDYSGEWKIFVKFCVKILIPAQVCVIVLKLFLVHVGYFSVKMSDLCDSMKISDHSKMRTVLVIF